MIAASNPLMACILAASLLSWPLCSAADTATPDFPEPAGLVTFGSGMLSAEALEQYRGGTQVLVDNTNATDGAVYGNQAHNLVTGSNLIDSSFSGANGLSTVVQNTGNNVLIQVPVIVNLQVQ